MKFNKLNDILNVSGEVIPYEEVIEVQEEEIVSEADPINDIDFAKNTIRKLINKNDVLINNMKNIAEATEHPRAYEVTGKLIKTQSELAIDLLNVVLKSKPPEPKGTQQIETQNNIVFAGTSTQLMELLRKNK